jgi:hypothetical protein
MHNLTPWQENPITYMALNLILYLLALWENMHSLVSYSLQKSDNAYNMYSKAALTLLQTIAWLRSHAAAVWNQLHWTHNEMTDEFNEHAIKQKHLTTAIQLKLPAHPMTCNCSCEKFNELKFLIISGAALMWNNVADPNNKKTYCMLYCSFLSHVTYDHFHTICYAYGKAAYISLVLCGAM